AGLVGGGILVGSSDEDVIPNVTIRNSTITGNTAAGSSDDYPMGSYGGGVFVRNGRLTIVSSTIVRNNAALGGGVAMWGSEPAEVDEGEEPPPPPPPTSFISSSIIVDNDNDGEGTDVESVGMTDDDEMPLPFDPLIASAGYNIIGVLGATMPPLLPTDLPEGTNPQFMDVNEDGEYDLWDFGGSTDVFMPDIGSPAIDAGGPSFNSGSFEQRGRHYSRVFNYTGTPQPIMDIGATERQAVRFLVDELFDEPENEGQTAGVYRLIDPVLGVFQILGYDAPGDFTIREALGFARKNTDSSVIAFSQALRFREFENNPNAQVSPPTILLTLGPLVVSTPTVIEGPTNFILEIDASGNDPTPLVNDGLGSRVFHIFAPTQISNLTLMGGDINNALGGGAILAQADLTLRDMTVKENFIAGDGGAVAVRNGTLDISGTTFKNNIATINGGAVYVFAGTTNISNSTFSGNQANGRGGAIANNNGNLAIRYSTITLNTASTTRGSGLWTLNGAMANTTIHGTIISNNSI
ncbi:MAG TPA: hypothetical protein PJ982_20225, partial [Lacipirellulaceae bacterium]|nr:hypothetical protein [Lacipirellulaceae bacterium]